MIQIDGLDLETFIARYSRVEAERRIGQAFTEFMGEPVTATIDEDGIVHIGDDPAEV